MYRRPYVESSVFIAYIKREMRGDDHDCKAVFESLLDAASSGDFAIHTSSLTIAEVFKNKRKGVELTEQENFDLRPYFREPYIRIIEVDREIGERANELCRTHKASFDVPALRPNDAIHMACAERAECEALLAYDPDLLKQSHDTMRIEWPQMIRLVAIPTMLALEDGDAAFQEHLALEAPEEPQS
jgi:predicted nucleic acid-binding protein